MASLSVTTSGAAASRRPKRGAAEEAKKKIKQQQKDEDEGKPSMWERVRCQSEEAEVTDISANTCSVKFHDGRTATKQSLHDVVCAPYITAYELKELPAGTKVRIFQKDKGSFYYAEIIEHFDTATRVHYYVLAGEDPYDTLNHLNLPLMQLLWDCPPPTPKTPAAGASSKKRGAPESKLVAKAKKKLKIVPGQKCSAKAATLDQRVEAAKEKADQSASAFSSAAAKVIEDSNAFDAANAQFQAAKANLAAAKTKRDGSKALRAQAKKKAKDDKAALTNLESHRAHINNLLDSY